MNHTISRLTKALLDAETERERLKNSLGEVEEKLNLIIGSVTEIIYTLDNNGLITSINDSVKSFGFVPQELIGIDIFQLVHPEDRERAVYHVNERRKGERGTKAFEIRLRTREAGNGRVTRAAAEAPPILSLDAEGQWAVRARDRQEFLGTIGIAKPLSTGRAGECITLDTAVNAAKKDDSGLIPICSTCKKIRMNDGSWISIEQFLTENGKLALTHTICNDCLGSFYSKL